MDENINSEDFNADKRVNCKKDKYFPRTPAKPVIPTEQVLSQERAFGVSRFIRNPNLVYLGKALMLEADGEKLLQIAVIGYNFTVGGEACPLKKYIQKSELATLMVESKIETALQDDSLFENLLREISTATSYDNLYGIKKEGKLRDRSQLRHESVPVVIYESINTLAQKLGGNRLPELRKEKFYQHEPHGGLRVDAVTVLNNNSLKPLGELIKEVRDDYLSAIDAYKSGNENVALDKASSGLYKMFNAWFWSGANSSRSMLVFNVVLEKIGIKPLPHGVIDFAAYLMDEQTFISYIRYLKSIN